MANKIKCSHILVEKQSQAIAILDRIKQGEKFGKLAKELSIDSGSAKKMVVWDILAGEKWLRNLKMQRLAWK